MLHPSPITLVKFRSIGKVNLKSLGLEFRNRISSSEPPRSRTRVDVHSKKQVTISPFRRKLCLRRLGFGALTVQTSVDIAMPPSSLAMAVHWSHGLPRSLLRALQGVRHEGICTLGHQDSFCLKFDHISKMSTKKHRESESLEENE